MLATQFAETAQEKCVSRSSLPVVPGKHAITTRGERGRLL